MRRKVKVKPGATDLRAALKYKVVCLKHDVEHVKVGDEINGETYGCPVCVAKIRADVQRILHGKPTFWPARRLAS